MELKKIILSQFKNYESQELLPEPGLNWFTGLNGMGKTNMLDAIYYLCMTKSMHGTPDRDLVRHQSSFFRLEGHFQLDSLQRKIVAKVDPPKRKVFEANGMEYDRLADHIGLIPIVFVAPSDAALVQGGSEDRRRFLDNALSQTDPLYLNHLITYNRLIKQRNAALKQMGQNGHFDRTLFRTYDRQLLMPASYIFQQRTEYLNVFLPRFQQYYQIICQDREMVDCRYQSHLQEQSMDAWLESNWEKDRILQRTNAGIHRDDLVFYIFDRPVKRFASQGQMKSFVLALKLAQYDTLQNSTQRIPILLLDDIFDKLDQERVRKLIELVQEPNFGQVFITDTRKERVESLAGTGNRKIRIFEVEDGKISNT
ncbi:MAG: DNA replication and repair protein RecF [Saprospiraceae bacterium]|nr:DNA replication and repair protein RecF [Saprospiraceae bacterium]